MKEQNPNQTSPEAKVFYAHVARNPQELLAKLTGKDERNIISSIIRTGKYSPTANHNQGWSTNNSIGILFDTDLAGFLSYFPLDVYSDDEHFKNYQRNIYRIINRDLDSLATEDAKKTIFFEKQIRSRPRIMTRDFLVIAYMMPNRYVEKEIFGSFKSKPDLFSALSKEQEKEDPSTRIGIKYHSKLEEQKSMHLEDRYVRSESKQKYENQKLEYNETHIKAGVADIYGIFVSPKDLKESKGDFFSNLVSRKRMIESERSQSLKNPEKLKYLAELEKQKFAFLKDRKKYLELKKKEYEEALRGGVSHKDLKQAFKRKEEKNRDFDPKNELNKQIWLNSNIKKLEQQIKNLGSEINKRFEKHGDVQHNNTENLSEERITEDLKVRLSRPIDIFVHDPKQGSITKLDDSLIDDHKKKLEADFSRLYQPGSKYQHFLLRSNDSNQKGMNLLNYLIATSRVLDFDRLKGLIKQADGFGLKEEFLNPDKDEEGQGVLPLEQALNLSDKEKGKKLARLLLDNGANPSLLSEETKQKHSGLIDELMTPTWKRLFNSCLPSKPSNSPSGAKVTDFRVVKGLHEESIGK